MGALINAEAWIYSDSTRQNLVAKIPYKFGVPVGSTATVSFRKIPDDTFYTSRVSPGEDAYLGGSAYYPGDAQYLHQLGDWLPLCELQVSTFWRYYYYVEFHFPDGSYTTPSNNNPIQNSVYDLHLSNGDVYTNYGGSDQYKYNATLTAVTGGKYRGGYSCLVASRLNSDGTIPTDATFAFYYANENYSATDLWGGISGGYSYQDVKGWVDLFNLVLSMPPPPTDPYGWNEPTGPSDPLDEHTLVQNNVDFPTLPTAAAINAGFVSVWVPQLFQVQNLANYMWNINILSADFWKKLVASPLELIYGLSIIPYDFRSAESEYQVHTDNLTLGYVNTKLSMDYVE